MRHTIAFLLAFTSLSLLSWGQSFSASNHDNQYIALSWSSDGTGATYQVQRHFSFQDTWETIVATGATALNDTIRRHLCNDTIYYRILSSNNAAYPMAQAPFTDAQPTAPPSLNICQVDSASDKIKLRWNASPDPDIMGYVFCRRDDPDDPWIAFDTQMVDQGLQLVVEDDATLPHYYRIYAFDSCLTASPMTDPCGNITLSISSDPCDSKIDATWTAYTGMDVAKYRVELVPFIGTQVQPTIYSESLSLSTSVNVPATATQVAVTVIAVEQSGNRTARSNTVTRTFNTSDTASYIRPLSASVNDDNKSIKVIFEVDPSFATDHYTLYRSNNYGNYTQIAQINYTETPTVSYTDHSVSPSDENYSYRLGVMDGCGRNEKLSPSISPIHLTTSELSDDGIVHVDWNTYDNHSGNNPTYQLMRRMGGSWEEVTSSTFQNSYDDQLEHPGFNISYRVKCSVGGDEVWSNSSTVIVPAHLWIPNAFTPEANTNQLFCISANGMSDYELAIFNRQGLQVFYSQDPSACWDGRNPDATPASLGAYTYRLYFVDNHGSPQIVKGTVMLIR